MSITKRTYEVPTEIGMMSLIGVHGDPPYQWGNYFWLARDNIRVYNFWAENLVEARNRFLEDGRVQITRWDWNGGSGCIIDDHRIPEDWYYNKLCFTGTQKPHLEVARQIFDTIGGDPTSELELWTDPSSYWNKRGRMHNSKTGVVTTKCRL